MISGTNGVCVVGAGFSDPERPARSSLHVHATKAIDKALADAALNRADIDGLATYPRAPFIGAGARDGVDVVSVEYVARQPGFTGVRWAAETNSGMIASSVGLASAALAAGLCSYVLVWRAMGLPNHRYGQLEDAPPAGGDAQFSAPWQLISPVQWHALAFRRYLERYRLDPALLSALAVESRRRARESPYAFFRDRPLSTEQYLDSRVVSDPLRLYDCDVPVQACVALVLTASGRARHAPWSARLAGSAVNVPAGPPKLDYTLDDHLERGRHVADRLRRNARLDMTELTAAQIYDGFAPSVLYWLEGAGFCGPGEALGFLQDGAIAPGGRLPLNTFGGSLSAGRLHGLAHIAEAALQVGGRAGPRQLPGAQAIGVFVGSPMLDGGAFVLTPGD